MHFTLRAMAAIIPLLAAAPVSAAEHGVAIKPGLVYGKHGGVTLVGDLYLPKGRARAPVLVAMHGGAWRVGSRSFYAHWAQFLARNGYAVFAIDYRLGRAGVYPAPVCDTRAAIQFLRAKAAEFDIDADRVGLMGDSAGGYLAALVALAGDRPNTACRDDPNTSVTAGVKAVVGFYGIYDLTAQWQHDSRDDNIVQEFLGVAPHRNSALYAEASPVSHVANARKTARFLLLHGARDTLVDPATQTGAFDAALTQAGFQSREIIVPGAAHFWVSDPFEDDSRSYSAMVAPQVLRFLDEAL